MFYFVVKTLLKTKNRNLAKWMKTCTFSHAGVNLSTIPFKGVEGEEGLAHKGFLFFTFKE